MSDDFLYYQPEMFIAAILLLTLLLAGELGYRYGLRGRDAISEPAKSQLNSMQGAIIGILALLLGFTFSMAEGRFDNRKQMVIEEANAIGTASLRSQLLQEPQRSKTKSLLLEYIDTRINTVEIISKKALIEGMEMQASRLQKELWAEAVEAGERSPNAVTISLYIQSLNEVFDIKEKRAAALANHVPECILFLLATGSALTTGFVGYGCGIGSNRLLTAKIVLSLLITLVIIVIIDLDRPQRGFITVSQQSMIRLRDTMKAPQ